MRPRTFIRALSVLLFSLPGAWAAELELRCKLEQNQYICSQETDPDAEETPNEAVAEGPNTSLVTCKPYSDNVSFAPFNKDGAIGTHYFGSKEECEKAISMQSQGWICTRGPGNGLSSPFNIKEGKDGGEFYLNGLDECLRAIQNVKGDLICAAGWSRTSFIAWDFKQGHYVENHSNGSLDSCNQRINSGKAGEKAHVVEAALHDCSHVRMDEPGGSMEHVAVRDQGTLPICAAETVAQVTDAWRFANGDTNYDFQTSGLYAALLAYHANGAWELDDGLFPPNVIAAISGGGSCSKDSTVEVQESQLVQDLVALLKRIRYRKHQNPKKPLELTEEEREGLARYIGNPNCLGALGLVPEFDVLEDILRAAHPKKMLAEVLAHRCKNGNLLKVSVPPLAQTLYAPAKSPTEIANFFADRIKARTDLPTQVTICEKVFNRPNYRLIAEPVEAWNRHSCKDSLHSMLVIGKRRNPESGRCEFLLRNSWGTDCGPSGVNFKCENGSIWVDADTLARVTLRAFELQRGKR